LSDAPGEKREPRPWLPPDKGGVASFEEVGLKVSLSFGAGKGRNVARKKMEKRVPWFLNATGEKKKNRWCAVVYAHERVVSTRGTGRRPWKRQLLARWPGRKRDIVTALGEKERPEGGDGLSTVPRKGGDAQSIAHVGWAGKGKRTSGPLAALEKRKKGEMLPTQVSLKEKKGSWAEEYQQEKRGKAGLTQAGEKIVRQHVLTRKHSGERRQKGNVAKKSRRVSRGGRGRKRKILFKKVGRC